MDMIAIYLLPQKKTYEDYKYTREDGGSGFGCCGSRSSSSDSSSYEPTESLPIIQKK